MGRKVLVEEEQEQSKSKSKGNSNSSTDLGPANSGGAEGVQKKVLLGGHAVAEIQERLQGQQPKAQIRQLQKDTSIRGIWPLLPLIDIMGHTRSQVCACVRVRVHVSGFFPFVCLFALDKAVLLLFLSLLEV